MNHVVRRVSISSGLVTTLAGTAGISGSLNAVGAAARFNAPVGVAVDAAGTFALVVSGVVPRHVVFFLRS